VLKYRTDERMALAVLNYIEEVQPYSC